MKEILFGVLGIHLWVTLARGHGRLIEPPSRASMWRVGYDTPKDENDNQAYCGGFGVQYSYNNGKCGICGDPWDVVPRPHEAPDGIFANGIIARTYSAGSLIPIIIDVSVNHRGHFEFKICPNNNIFEDSDQWCFDQFPVKTGPSLYKYPILDDEVGLRILYIQLPHDLNCKQCVMQWTYLAGNNWGVCSNGTSGIGCGPQEMFRSCADIQVVSEGSKTRDYIIERESPVFQDEDYFTEEDDQDAISVIKEDSKEATLLRKQLLKEIVEQIEKLVSLSQKTEVPAQPPSTPILPENESIERSRSTMSLLENYENDSIERISSATNLPEYYENEENIERSYARIGPISNRHG